MRCFSALVVVITVVLAPLLACDPPHETDAAMVIDGNYNPVDASSDSGGVDVAMPPDGGESDLARADGAMPDGAMPDGARADGAMPDGAMPDGAMPDGAMTDGAMTDGAMADGATPDGGMTDAGGTDAGGVACGVRTFSYSGSVVGEALVSGTFNGWPASAAAGAWAMSDPDGDGTWSVSHHVTPGMHQYKLVIDGVWITDPTNPDTVDDGGNINSVLIERGCPDSCSDEFDWRDAVLYFVMVDRFRDDDSMADPVAGASDGDALNGPSAQYEGGDLAGVEERLGYLTDLGVTALWLTAPYENRDTAGGSMDPGSDAHFYSAYHGYWPSPADVDYSNIEAPSPRPLVESRIGDEAALHSLVQAAHAASSVNGDGVKVLLDYVMNHVDSESPLYSAHPGWFIDPVTLCQPTDLWNDPYWGTRCAFNAYLPAFDFYEPDALAWSVNDAVWWASAFGIDGYRLDAIKHVPMEWLTTLRARLDSAMTDPAGGRFYLVGETFDYTDRDLLASFVDPATKLDGQFDFPFKNEVCQALFTPSGSLDALSIWMGGNDGYYGPGSIMTTWIGNHDIPRAIHFASGQIGNCTEGSHGGNSWTGDYPQPTTAEPYQRLGLAFAVMMTNPGIPLIYYGDEIGLAGGGDPDNRRSMPWEDRGATLNPHQQALRAQVRVLARLRSQHHALSRGFREWLSSDTDTWVYRMSGCGIDDEVLVAINRADGEREVVLPDGAYFDLIAEVNATGGRRTLPARGLLVLGPR